MKRIFPLFMFVVLAATQAFAAPISGIGTVTQSPPSTGSVAFTGPAGPPTAPGVSVIGVPPFVVFDYTSIVNNLTSGTPNPNDLVQLDLTYNNFGTLDVPVNLGAGAINNIYLFQVTINNNFNNAAHPITNFNAKITSGGATFVDPLGQVAASGQIIPATNPNALGWGGAFATGYHFQSPTSIHFGPNSHTGSGIPFGSSSTVSFLLSTGINPPSSFTLSFTANPEPTSIALAGAALAGFGGVIIRRRRNKLAKAE